MPLKKVVAKLLDLFGALRSDLASPWWFGARTIAPPSLLPWWKCIHTGTHRSTFTPTDKNVVWRTRLLVSKTADLIHLLLGFAHEMRSSSQNSRRFLLHRTRFAPMRLRRQKTVQNLATAPADVDLFRIYSRSVNSSTIDSFTIGMAAMYTRNQKIFTYRQRAVRTWAEVSVCADTPLVGACKPLEVNPSGESKTDLVDDPKSASTISKEKHMKTRHASKEFYTLATRSAIPARKDAFKAGQDRPALQSGTVLLAVVRVRYGPDATQWPPASLRSALT